MGKYHYQIYLGTGTGRGYTLKDVLKALPPKEYISSLIVGWARVPEIYRGLRKFTREIGAELWLWYPVLSEHSREMNVKMITDIETGKEVGGKTFDGDEAFDFSCPTDSGLTGELMDLFEKNYAEYEFDGVFLDRIRYPSLTFGISALFGCACRSCRAWFISHGLQENAMEQCYLRLKEKIADPECDNPLGLLRYCEGTYDYEDKVLSHIIDLRKERISEMVITLAEELHRRNLKVGADVFAPFLGDFVGQECKRLAGHMEMIKPMLYRMTYTPAGMMYEIDGLLKAISNENAETNKRRKKKIFRVLGLAEGSGAEQFFARETEYIAGLRQMGTQFVPGLEIHTIPGNPGILPEDIVKSTVILENAGLDSRVACWNIMGAENRNLKAFVFGNYT